MTDRAPPLALRQLRAHLSAPFVLAAQAGIAVVVGLSGPFGTFERLGPVLRLAYWAGIVFSTYALGCAITLLLLDRLDRSSRWPAALRVLRGGVIIGAAVVVLLWLWGLPFFGPQGVRHLFAPTSVLGAFIVSWVVLGLRALYPAPHSPRAQGTPALLARLRLEHRAPLVALSATDHYVEVITEKGRELVLMRLSDAIAETAPTLGLQVHRSHWVALGQVRKVTRRGDGAVLELAEGVEIPVSRRYMRDIRAAGLLPAR